MGTVRADPMVLWVRFARTVADLMPEGQPSEPTG